VNYIPEWDSDVDEDAMIEELKRIEQESGKGVNPYRHSSKRLLQSYREIGNTYCLRVTLADTQLLTIYGGNSEQGIKSYNQKKI